MFHQKKQGGGKKKIAEWPNAEKNFWYKKRGQKFYGFPHQYNTSNTPAPAVLHYIHMKRASQQ